MVLENYYYIIIMGVAHATGQVLTENLNRSILSA
jgi:hypothetical protein